MHRHELTDKEWGLIKELLPANGKRGEQWKDHRTIFNGMFWRLRTGAPWRDIPERYGSWKTIYSRFNRYRQDGTLERIIQALQLKLDAQGLIDWDLWCVDGTQVRATRSAAGAGKKGATKSPPTTPLAAPEAGLGAKSTWWLTAEACRLPPTSPQDRSTTRRSSKKR